MKCLNCNGDMNLRCFSKDSDLNYFYECSKCGTLEKARQNFDYISILQKRIENIKEFSIELHLLFDKNMLEFLSRHPNPLPIIAYLSRKEKSFWTWEKFNELFTEVKQNDF